MQEQDYRIIWNNLLSAFSVSQSAISAWGNGERFSSTYDIRQHLDKYGLKNIGFHVAVNRSLFKGRDADWEKFAIDEFGKIKQRYESFLTAIDGIVPVNDVDISIDVCFNVEEVSTGNYGILKSIKDKSTALLSNISVEFRVAQDFWLDLKVDNSRMGWTAAWASYKARILQLKAINARVHIKATFRTFVTSNEDIINLRYYLPLWHHISNAHNSCNLALYSKEQKSKSNYSEKTRQWASSYPDIQSSITFDDGVLSNRTDIGDLFPIICFKAESGSDADSTVSSHGAQIIENPNKSKKYDKLLNGYFLYLMNTKKYKGTHEHNLSPKDKEKIRDDLLCFLLKKIRVGESFAKEMQKSKSVCKRFAEILDITNKFHTMLFLYLIKNHIDSKDIITEDESNNWVLNEYLVDKAWSNAKTYAEGLLQLIENAQLHSNGHVAYFGMRIYKADPRVSVMSNLTDEANTRKSLWDKYRHGNETALKDIFNANEHGATVYSDFLEFYVLDDAIDGKGNTSGIYDSIQKSGTLSDEQKKKINSIGDFLQLKDADGIEKLEFYTQHYGMQLLEKHVNRLNGVVEVYSPHKDYDYSYFLSENYDKELGMALQRKCFYSNRVEPPEDENYVNLYSSEYSILIPLEYKQKNKAWGNRNE